MLKSKRTGQFGLQVLYFMLLTLVAVLLTMRAEGSGGIPQAKLAVSKTVLSNSANVPQNNQFKFGLYINSAKDVTTDQKDLNAKLNILGWFVHWNETIQSNKLIYACTNGYVPEITWESRDAGSTNTLNDSFPLSAIAAGQFDSYIKQQLTFIKDDCQNQTVIIRLDQEMDTPDGIVGWYPWQGNPATYVKAWQHIVTISRKIDPQIKWLWSPNRGTQIAEQYYPGNQWVDYVGLTLNRGVLEEQIPSFATFFEQNQAVIESFQKPIIISEATDQEGPNVNSKALYVSGMFNYLRQTPQILAVVWFNTTTSYKFNSSSTTLQAFQQGLISRGGK